MKKTEDIISLANGKPLAVTGIGRSGTSFINRQLYRHAVMNSSEPQGFLEEFMRLSRGIYEYQWEPIPRVKDFSQESAYGGYLFSALSNKSNKRYSGFNLTTDEALEYLRPRIEKLKKHGLDNLHLKIFPIDFCVLHKIDEEFCKELLYHYHWIFLYREDWKDAFSSLLFGATRDKFHFYDDEDIMNTDTWKYGGAKDSKSFVNPYTSTAIMDQSYGMINSIFTKEVSCSIIEMKEIKEIPDNYNEFLNVNCPYKPNDFWTQSPKMFSNKKEFTNQALINLDKAKDRAEKRLKQIVDGSNGLMTLDGDSLRMDGSKLRYGKPLLEYDVGTPFLEYNT